MNIQGHTTTTTKSAGRISNTPVRRGARGAAAPSPRTSPPPPLVFVLRPCEGAAAPCRTSHDGFLSPPQGYYDFGTMGLYPPTGVLPTATSTGDAPFIFTSYTSVLNSGVHDGSLEHQYLRGMSVGTVGGVPMLPKNRSVFAPIPGFDSFNGAAFGFHFETNASVWIADAGMNAIDKDSCSIQHWVSPSGSISGPWSYDRRIVVDASVPCFSMFGRVEGGALYLYLSTSTVASSKIYRVAAATGDVVVIKIASSNTVYRAVSLPPMPRANYTCPAGSFGTTNDMACSFSCCAPCKTSCPAGLVLVQTCSIASDNTCIPPSAYNVSALHLPPYRASAVSIATGAGGSAMRDSPPPPPLDTTAPSPRATLPSTRRTS